MDAVFMLITENHLVLSESGAVQTDMTEKCAEAAFSCTQNEGFLHRVRGHGVSIFLHIMFNRYIKNANARKIVKTIEVK